MSSLVEIIKGNKRGKKCGVFSICSANRLFLEAAILQAKKDQTAVLVEATSNQVNQFGGYTGITTAERASYTLECHKKTFAQCGLADAWERVVGLVVQPSVEFDHTSVIDYERSKAEPLSQFIKSTPNIVFEAHSTDYQLPEAYVKLVEDHFAILKVGPQLTFAMREAIYSLAHIEDTLIPEHRRSHIRSVMEDEVLTNPQNWKKYYEGNEEEQRFARSFSYSDRIRYHWVGEAVELALNKLLNNLSAQSILMPLISQYLPEQFWAIREGKIKNDPRSLIHYRIMQVTDFYAKAC